MTKEILVMYLVDGLPVGQIARRLGKSRADIRASLREAGITLRPTKGGYLRGRGQVCDAIRRIGFDSFHEFVQVKGLDPITEQAERLSVSEKSLARVYNTYRKLLRSLKTDGVILPTPQSGQTHLERRTPEP